MFWDLATGIQRLAAISVLLFGIWSCQAGSERRTPHQQSTLTTSDKVHGLSQVWKETSYNVAFFDKVPDLDWDATYRQFVPQVLATGSDREYDRVPQKSCALLRDGHTNVYPPQHVPQQEERATDTPSIQVHHFQHRAIVINVGQSLKDEPPLGSEMVAVDGIATKQYHQSEVFPYISSSTEHVL